MPQLSRRTLLSVISLVGTTTCWAAEPDTRKTQRSLGSVHARTTVIEYFSLTCPHCASFALNTLPELKTQWIDPGRMRWVFQDFPGDLLALQAANIARYLAPDRYYPFTSTLFANQDRWAFGSDADAHAELWKLAESAGLSRARFDQAVADKDLGDWIVQQEMSVQERWHVDATPSFVANGKLHEGDMPASEFVKILAS